MDKRILVEIFKRTVSGLAIVAVLLFVPLPAIIKSLLLLIFLIYLAYRVSNLLVTDPESRMTQIALGLIVILAWLIISLSLCFYLDQISRPAVLICFIPLILLASGQQQIKSKTKNTNRQPTRSIWSLGLTAGVVIGDAVLLLAYLIARTSEPLRTPWDVIPWPALLLFGVTTWLLFLICHERRGIGRYSLTALHLFTAYSLAEIVIACGFGFDPFIHRTAEAYIAEHGFILPKQPYYTGQYVIVVALKWLTGLSIDSIDRWLVLVLGPLTLPWIIPLGLKRAWKITDQSTSFWTPIILLLPLSPLIFTVPYSLSFLILIWLVFLAPLIRKRWRDRLLILGLSLAMLAIHPLLGAVAIGLVTALLLPTWLNSWLTGLVTIVINAMLLPVMFAFNNIKRGVPPFNSNNPLADLDRFIGLFTNPHTHNQQIIFTYWDLLYSYRTALPFFLFAVAIIGTILINKRIRRTIAKPYWLTLIGVLIAIFILSTSVIIPGIISNEQLEFSLRLKQSLSILLLPLFIFGISQIGIKRWQHNLVRTSIITFCFALLATAAWYLTYPQANIRAAQTGWSVSQADFEAAQLIKNAANDQPYIALSNQMLSVAALRMNGFENFSFALPTGERLYEFYLVLSYYRRNPSVIQEIFSTYDVSRIFYAIHTYEPLFELIVNDLGSFSSQNWSTADNSVVIFMFKKE